MNVLPEQDIFVERLYRQYFKKLTLYSLATLKNPAQAQDTVQDTFHEAILHIEILMTHENPGGWLMQTLKNKIRESERSRRRYLRHFISLDSDISAELVPASEQIVEIHEPDENVSIEKVQQALTLEEFKFLTRFIFDKASHLEVAQEYGITVYASQKRLERIRKKLYEAFPERKRKKL